MAYTPVVPNSQAPETIFPEPVQRHAPPFSQVDPPDHISFQVWQDSYYDASSHAPMSAFTQRPAGPCHLDTGRLVDGDWPEGAGPWKQV